MKAKDIKGFLVDEKYVEANTQLRGGEERVTSWNNCLRQQGEKSLTLNREKLAQLLYEKEYGIKWNSNQFGELKDEYRDLADAIISSLPDILECDEK